MRFAIVVLVLALCAVSAGSAQGLDLIWSTGSHDLAIGSSAACTLLVTGTGPSDPLPEEWHLVWSGEGPAGPPPHRLGSRAAADRACGGL